MGPSRMYSHDQPPPMGDVKPLLMEKPLYFKGAHDNIERFLGDCKTYFEVFQCHYMQHPVLMVVFTSLLFQGPTQDWWVHLRNKYDYVSEGMGDYDDDAPFDGGAQYRFPTGQSSPV